MLVEWNECCKNGKIQSFKTLMTQSEIISQWIGNYTYLKLKFILKRQYFKTCLRHTKGRFH